MWKTSERALTIFAFRIIGDFGVSIAVPAVAAALIGKALDARFGTRPWITVVCLALAFALTAFSFKRKATRYGREYAELLRKSDTSN